MAKLRGLEITKDASRSEQVWRWVVSGRKWDFRLTPTRGLWRGGVKITAPLAHLICADDAVLFSIGWEMGRLAGLSEEGRQVSD